MSEPRSIVLRAVFRDPNAGRWARASLRRLGAVVRTSLAPSGAYVVETHTDPYTRPQVESVIVLRGGELAHVRTPSPARRDEDRL